MNRRDWLKRAALLAAAGIAADQLDLLDRLQPRRLFAAWPTTPTLYGDGVHDDTLALQAWCDGRAVRWRGREQVGGLIAGSDFRVSRTLYAGRGKVPCAMAHSRILWRGELPAGIIIAYIPPVAP